MTKRKTRRTRRSAKRRGGSGNTKTKRSWYQFAKENPYISIPTAVAGLALAGKYGVPYVSSKLAKVRSHNYYIFLQESNQKIDNMYDTLNNNPSNETIKKLILDILDFGKKINNRIQNDMPHLETHLSKSTINTISSRNVLLKKQTKELETNIMAKIKEKGGMDKLLGIH